MRSWAVNPTTMQARLDEGIGRFVRPDDDAQSAQRDEKNWAVGRRRLNAQRDNNTRGGQRPPAGGAHPFRTQKFAITIRAFKSLACM